MITFYFSILQSWLEPKYELIAQAPPSYDAGDTAQREGMFAVASFILHKMDKMSNEEYAFVSGRYDRVVRLLNDPKHPGLIRRYPDEKYWGGLSDRMSRDQAVPNVIAMGLMNEAHLKSFYDGHTKYSWRWFTTNTRNNWAWPPGDPRYNPKEYRWKLPDLTIMSFSAAYIRAFKKRDVLSKLRLWWYDLDLLGGTVAKIYHSRDPEESDDLNHIMLMYQSEIESPTLWSKLAFWLYHRYRKYPSQVTWTHVPDATTPSQACLNSYFRGNQRDQGPKLEVVFSEVTDYMWKSFSWKLKNKFD